MRAGARFVSALYSDQHVKRGGAVDSRPLLAQRQSGRGGGNLRPAAAPSFQGDQLRRCDASGFMQAAKSADDHDRFAPPDVVELTIASATIG